MKVFDKKWESKKFTFFKIFYFLLSMLSTEYTKKTFLYIHNEV